MMNKIIAITFIMLPVFAFSQDTSSFSQVPDSVYVALDGDTVLFVAKDAKEVAQYFLEVYKDTKANKPQTGQDWLLYLFGLLTTGGLLARLIQLAKVVSQLQAFMAKKNSPTNIAAAVSAAIGFGVAAVWPGAFDMSIAISATGIVFTGATIIYMNFIKKQKVYLNVD